MLKKFIKYIFFKLREKSIFNTGLAIANINANKKKIHSFKDIEFSSFSQNGTMSDIDIQVEAVRLSSPVFNDDTTVACCFV
jgi:hypothetical protein